MIIIRYEYGLVKMKQNQKFNSKLIFLGTLLLVITFAFIFTSGCVTDGADYNLHQLQKEYTIESYGDENVFVSLDFPQAGRARMVLLLPDNEGNCTTVWKCERNENKITGIVYQFYLNDKLQIIENPMDFEINIIDDSSIQLTFNGYVLSLKSI